MPVMLRRCRRYMPKKVKKENSIVVKKPEIAKQWHPDKNKGVNPNEVGAYAREEYWWLCAKCGHDWHKPPNNRRSAKCERCKK